MTGGTQILITQHDHLILLFSDYFHFKKSVQIKVI